MIFTYDYWDDFCKQLYHRGIKSIPARELMHDHPSVPYFILKHDVETNVANALKIAEIEHKWGHYGSYYVQAYLLEDARNVELLHKIQKMGHEISYHYDVMDANTGDIPAAIKDFCKKCELFEQKGFHLETLCQHGNPIVERRGYASNRDFFRNQDVQRQFPNLTDIMVDFKEKAKGNTDYLYFSDAGRRFKLIYDPINNDVIPSDDKNIPFDTLSDLLAFVYETGENAIISIHPHRWVASRAKYILRTAVFKGIRLAAKLLIQIPFIRKIMNKYYFLAKKF